jgi:phage shock protein A
LDSRFIRLGRFEVKHRPAIDRQGPAMPSGRDEMTRSTLFDRLNQELTEFGKKAQAALDEGKLQIELLRYHRKQDKIARDLGMLIHRRERGGEVEARRVDALLMRLDDLAKDIARLEGQIAEARRQRAAAAQQPPSEPAQPPVPTATP